MSPDTRSKLRILAVLGAITGAGLVMEGSALAAPVLRGCSEDTSRGRYGSECDYDVYPMQMPAPGITPTKRPDPIPPYSS